MFTITVAAMTHINADSLAATRSSLLDRYTTGLFQGPRVCGRTPPPSNASGLIHIEMEYFSNSWEGQGRHQSHF